MSFKIIPMFEQYDRQVSKKEEGMPNIKLNSITAEIRGTTGMSFSMYQKLMVAGQQPDRDHP